MTHNPTELESYVISRRAIKQMIYFIWSPNTDVAIINYCYVIPSRLVRKAPKNTVAILVLSKSSGYIGADEKMVSRLLTYELTLTE